MLTMSSSRSTVKPIEKENKSIGGALGRMLSPKVTPKRLLSIMWAIQNKVGVDLQALNNEQLDQYLDPNPTKHARKYKCGEEFFLSELVEGRLQLHVVIEVVPEANGRL